MHLIIITFNIYYLEEPKSTGCEYFYNLNISNIIKYLFIFTIISKIMDQKYYS